MKKKWIILGIVMILVIGTVITVNVIERTNNRYVPPEGDEEIYQLTEEEVARVNANSNLLGCELLGKNPAPSYEGPIRKDTDDNYMCFPYRGESLITAINLYSEDADIYGISVGDTVDSANSVLLAEGYVRTSAPENTFNYRKHYVCIGFDFDDDGVLVDLGIGVEDPAYRDVDE